MNDAGDDNPRVDAAFEEFVERCSNNERVVVDDFLSRHSDIRDLLEPRLRAFFKVRSDLDRAAGPSHCSVKGREIGDFVLLREIGSGGMGSVYEAEQHSLQRKVALKLLPFVHSLNPRQVARFRREAEAAAALQHPGIVPVHAVGEKDGTHFLVMDLVDGWGLDRVIGMLREREAKSLYGANAYDVIGSCIFTESRDSRTSRAGTANAWNRSILEWAVDLAAATAEALQHAHENGVVHRDVKPSNILVTRNGRPVLVDFGLACREGSRSVTLTGEFVGTPYYASPEQARSENIPQDYRTDIYSLGVTLYELLSLRVPFEGKTRQEVVNKILTHEPPSMRKSNPSLPRDVETVVFKAMEKDPGRRYASAADLAEDLRAFRENRPIRAKPAGLPTQAVKFAKRHRAMTAGIMLILISAMILITYLTTRESIRKKNRALSLMEDARGMAEGDNPELCFYPLLKGFRDLGDDPGAQNNMVEVADLMRQRGLYLAAKRLLEKVNEEDPPDLTKAESHYILGCCVFNELEIEAARDHWEAAVDLAGGSDVAAASREKLDILQCLEHPWLNLPAKLPANGFRPRFGGAISAVCLPLEGGEKQDLVTLADMGDLKILYRWKWDDQGKLNVSKISLDGESFDDAYRLFKANLGSEHGDCLLVAGEINDKAADQKAGHSKEETEDNRLVAWKWEGDGRFSCLWEVKFQSKLIQIACGDVDRDQHAEICVATGTDGGFFVLDGVEKDSPVKKEVRMGEFEHDEEVSGAAIFDMGSDGDEDLMFITRGHHRFALFKGVHEDGSYRGEDVYQMGVLEGCAVWPGDSGQPSSLVVARAFTPHREGLDALFRDKEIIPGLFGIKRRGNAWEVDCIWTPWEKMGCWFSPRSPSIGKSPDGHSHFLIARLHWRSDYPDLGEVYRNGCLFRGLPVQVNRKQDVLILNGTFNITMGELDGDDGDEIVLFNPEGISVFGLDYPAPASGSDEEFAGEWRLNKTDQEDRIRDETAELLVLSAMELIDSPKGKITDNLYEAFNLSAGSGRYALVNGLFSAWFTDDGRNDEEIKHIKADIKLFSGDYEGSAAAYRTIRTKTDSSHRGIDMYGLSLADKERLAISLARDETIEEIHEPFDDAVDGWYVGLFDGRGMFVRKEDLSGHFGGRYKKGPYAVFSCPIAENPEADRLQLAVLRSRTPLGWRGENSFRLSFHVYFSRLYYATGLEVEVRPEECEFLNFKFEHIRNTTQMEGDRYCLDFTGTGGADSKTGNFISEFPADQWMSVELTYIHELRMSRLLLRHLDRGPQDPPVAEIDLLGMDAPVVGDYSLRFSLVQTGREPSKELPESEILLDEIRFGIIDMRSK